MVAACGRIQDDVTVGAVILAGAGEPFPSGGNIKHMRYKQGTFGGDTITVRDNDKRGVQRVTLALYSLEAPTIAAVNGPAYRAGCDTAFARDNRIASERALFAENFVNLGIISGDGGWWLLPRATGMSRACDPSFAGDPVKAGNAPVLGVGLVVVLHEELIPEAITLARRIAAKPLRALGPQNARYAKDKRSVSIVCWKWPQVSGALASKPPTAKKPSTPFSKSAPLFLRT